MKGLSSSISEQNKPEHSPEIPFVLVDNVVKKFGTSTTTVEVLRGLNFRMAANESVGLLGRSGSGKSTLLNLLGGLDTPTAGRIFVAGHDLSHFDKNQRAEFRLTMVGMIFQSFYLIPHQSTLENVALPMIFAGIPRKEREDRAASILQEVGMSHRLDHRPNQLSGGEKQRVALARAIVNRPRLLLADEPTGNLDSATSEEAIGLIMNYVQSQHAALLLVTHDLELAKRCSTRIVRMHDGLISS